MESATSLRLDPKEKRPLLRDHVDKDTPGETIPWSTKRSHTLPSHQNQQDSAGILFIGTATTIIEWGEFRILTDPNFLHAGDHVHLGPGVTAQRVTNPALELDELPAVDCVLLSHYHEDHFDKYVEDSLNREFPIVTTPHAKECLTNVKDEPFCNVTGLEFFQSTMIDILAPKNNEEQRRRVKVTGLPGKHVPPGPLSVANDMVGAVPPTNGWLVELGYSNDHSEIETGYRIYISGDTLLVDELKEIPALFANKQLDLMLIHLGGTTIPGPKVPMLMVTMDATQGVQLMQLMDPKITIPIHFDDYDVFLSPLSDFKEQVEKTGLQDRVVYLDRGDDYRFEVRNPQR